MQLTALGPTIIDPLLMPTAPPPSSASTESSIAPLSSPLSSHNGSRGRLHYQRDLQVSGLTQEVHDLQQFQIRYCFICAQ